jgi:hypothetical protein
LVISDRSSVIGKTVNVNEPVNEPETETAPGLKSLNAEDTEMPLEALPQSGTE